MEVGDGVLALDNSTSSIWARGRKGIIECVFDPERGGNNLVRWGDDSILFGFNPKDVIIISKQNNEESNHSICIDPIQL